MAQLVKKDTFLYEDAGSGNMVRRQVFAGQFVPDHYVTGDDTDGGALEETEAASGPGLGAGEASYPHNRGVSVKDQLARRGQDSSDEAVAAAELGGAAAQEQMAKQAKSGRAARSGQKSPSETTPSQPQQG